MDKRKIESFYRIFTYIFVFSFAITDVSALTCRGVYFVQFPVSEIEGLYNGIIIDEDKGTCSRPIDIMKSDGFVQVEDSVSLHRAVSEILSGKSLEHVDIINLITPKRIIFSYTADLPVGLIRKNQDIVNHMTSFSPYYLSKDGEYLYKFVRLQVDINEVDLSNKNFQVERNYKSDFSSENIGYYIHDILAIIPYICYSSSNIWIPFKDYFEQPKEKANFKALYILRYILPRIAESSHEGKLVEVSSFNDAEIAVRNILQNNIPESNDEDRFVFPFIPNQYEKTKMPYFYNVGPTENIGVNLFSALNTETIIKEDLNLAPYLISEDGRYVYKIIYIEGTTTEYNQKKKKNYCYFVNLPNYYEHNKIDIVSGLTYSTPYLSIDSNYIWMPYKKTVY